MGKIGELGCQGRQINATWCFEQSLQYVCSFHWTTDMGFTSTRTHSDLTIKRWCLNCLLSSNFQFQKLHLERARKKQLGSFMFWARSGEDPMIFPRSKSPSFRPHVSAPGSRDWILSKQCAWNKCMPLETMTLSLSQRKHALSCLGTMQWKAPCSDIEFAIRAVPGDEVKAERVDPCTETRIA